MSADQEGGEIGVVIVVYNSSDVITDCLASVITSEDDQIRIVVIDNASPDDSAAKVRSWAMAGGVALEDRTVDPNNPDQLDARSQVHLLRCPSNLGFAGGVNVGLRALDALAQTELFWVLNPDCIVEPYTAGAYRDTAARIGEFGLMSGRTLYCDPPECVQSDGGTVSRWTGKCTNINNGLSSHQATMPPHDRIDYFIGANVVASREYLRRVGLMPEEYFLFYEEVEWAIRRGSLSLVTCPEAIVRHHAGTATGSAKLERRASPFASYYNYRNRLWFMRRNFPLGLPVAYLFSLTKVAQLLLQRDFANVGAALRGVHGLSPPKKA